MSERRAEDSGTKSTIDFRRDSWSDGFWHLGLTAAFVSLRSETMDSSSEVHASQHPIVRSWATPLTEPSLPCDCGEQSVCSCSDTRLNTKRDVLSMPAESTDDYQTLRAKSTEVRTSTSRSASGQWTTMHREPPPHAQTTRNRTPPRIVMSAERMSMRSERRAGVSC